MTGNLRTWNRSLKQTKKKKSCTILHYYWSHCRNRLPDWAPSKVTWSCWLFRDKESGGGGLNGGGKEVQAATSVLKTRLISLVGKNCEMRGNELRHCGRRKMGGRLHKKKGRDIPRLLQLLEEPPRHCHQWGRGINGEGGYKCEKGVEGKGSTIVPWKRKACTEEIDAEENGGGVTERGWSCQRCAFRL